MSHSHDALIMLPPQQWCNVQVTWGHISMIDAARNLLAVALADPLNQKFMLLSETDIPLYPPTVVYIQLISEPLSRVDACGFEVRSDWALMGQGYFMPMACCESITLWHLCTDNCRQQVPGE